MLLFCFVLLNIQFDPGMRISDTHDVRVIERNKKKKEEETWNYLKGLNAPIVDVVWLVVFCRSKRRRRRWNRMRIDEKRLFVNRLKSYWRDQLDILHLTERWIEKLRQIEKQLKQTLKRCWWWWRWWATGIFLCHIS